MRPHRKAITDRVKRIVLERQRNICDGCGVLMTTDDKKQFDHRPALEQREVNAKWTDYIPPQLDPKYIDALHVDCHLKRTVGRTPGADKTVTTKGSDAWLAAKFRRLEGRNKPKRRQKIPARPFQKRA